jgi:ferric-dicitrate binding protein FerR (iron transport regulator)
MLSTQDFLTNPEFVQWVKNPNRQLDEYWTNWIKANPDQLPILKLAREFLLRVHFEEIKAAEGLKEEILTGLLKTPSKTSDQRSVTTLHSPPPKINTGWHRLSQLHRIAAILIIGFGIGWLLSPSQISIDVPELVEVVPLIRKSTQAGEKLQVTLKDGTKVWMNAVSEIQFPEAFDSLERRITLKGEAYFEVATDTLRPFIVVTNGLSTTAVGTSFNISTKRQEQINISLLTGKVKISSGSDREDVYLNPGKELNYNLINQKQTVRAFDTNRVLAWKEGALLFMDANLATVVTQLEEWYGVRIQIENGDNIHWKYTAVYRNQSLEDVLNSISYTQQFNYSLEGKDVKLKF